MTTAVKQAAHRINELEWIVMLKDATGIITALWRSSGSQGLVLFALIESDISTKNTLER